MRARRRWMSVAGATWLAWTAPSPATAQAWLPPRGEAAVVLGDQLLHGGDHLTLDGESLDRGRMRWNTLICDLGYGLTDRVSVRVTVPYVHSKYTGAYPHLPPGRASVDDGAWHGSLQDIRLEGRVLATTGAIAVTPFVSATFPLAGYETHAHSAAGKGVRELTAGVYAGRRLDPALPDGYVHARVAFTAPERVLGVWNHRTNAGLELGYFVTPGVTVRATTALQVAHGGYRFPVDAPRARPAYLHHDQSIRERFFQVGAGAVFVVTGSMDVFVSVFETVRGTNSVRMRGATVGAAWGFSPARILRKKRDPGSGGPP